MSTENTTISSKQIMFVVWKWNDLTAVNEKAGEKSKLEKYLSEIKSNNSGSFFKEHEVETSDLCPNPLLVASYIYKTEVTRNLLYALLDKYAINNNEVMVFLHRGDFYDEDDVNHLLGEFGDRVAKCFLFADGRDYIYHKTQKSGFLDDAGGFKISRDRETGEQTCTYENSKVKQPYFDRVWEYYEIEFEIKVFQLKEELLDRWLLFLMPDQPDQINRKALIHAIQEQDDRLLWLRIKSFTDRFQVKELDEVKDFEQIDVLKDEVKLLTKLEKEKKVSYSFDDCIKNLNHHRKNERTFVADAYDEAKTTLERLLFDETLLDQDVSKVEIRALADQLNYLVKVIPGEMD